MGPPCQTAKQGFDRAGDETGGEEPVYVALMTQGYEPYRTLWYLFHQTGHFASCEGDTGRPGNISGCPHPITPEQLQEIKDTVGYVIDEHRSHPEGASLAARFMQKMGDKHLVTHEFELVQGLLECLSPYQAYDPYTTADNAPNGIYDHFKGGCYLKMAEGGWASGSNERTFEYLSMTNGKKFYRLATQWCEVVKWRDGKYRSRFVYRGPDLETPPHWGK
jgi:hypothetical protein